MNLLALDLGSVVSGFAYGEAGQLPQRSASIRMRSSSDEIDVAVMNIGKFLRDTFVFFMPDEIVVEDYITKMDMTNARTIIALVEMHGAVRSVAGLYGINVRRIHGNTVKKHFIGMVSALPKTKGGASSKQRAEARKATKAAIVKRAQLLGYVPRDKYDEDRSDACAIYDMACAVLFRKPIQNFKMFGG